ncbi:MAG: hypothetical protein LBH43_10490 [Treponema sp.]|nr:hypothetical protein [Treponema sp.]
MNKKMKIAAIVALVLLIAGVFAFAQSTGDSGQRPPYNLDEQYLPSGGGYGGGCGGCCGGMGGRW